MLRFISFGSGSSGNCYYLFTETDSLLIDVGVGIRTLKKHFHNYGLRFEDVHNILITHDHADHVKSVGSLSNDYHLPVYTTRKVWLSEQRLLKMPMQEIIRLVFSSLVIKRFSLLKKIVYLNDILFI